MGASGSWEETVLGIKCWCWQNHRISWARRDPQGPWSQVLSGPCVPAERCPTSRDNTPSPKPASPPGQDAKILSQIQPRAVGVSFCSCPWCPRPQPSLQWELSRRGFNFLCHFQFSFPQLNTVPLTSFAVEGAAFQQCTKQAALLTLSSTAWLIYDQLFPYYGSMQALPAQAGSPNVVTNAEQ